MSPFQQAEAERVKQEEAAAKKQQLEKEARPDAMHRAVVFLLMEAAHNNRDVSRQAKALITSLDSALANPEKLEELEDASKPQKPADAQSTAPNTAEHLKNNPPTTRRTSKRFEKRA